MLWTYLFMLAKEYAAVIFVTVPAAVSGVGCAASTEGEAPSRPTASAPLLFTATARAAAPRSRSGSGSRRFNGVADRSSP